MKAKEVTKVKLKEKWLQDELEAYNRRVDGNHEMFKLLSRQSHEAAENGREIWDKISKLYNLDSEKYRYSYDHGTKEINFLPKYGRGIAQQFPGKLEKVDGGS